MTRGTTMARGTAIVVGSGIAGLVAALEAGRDRDVLLVTKAAITESNTRYAQGGIAAVMFGDDSVASHVADTMAAGAGLGDRSAVEVLCTDGPERMRDLVELGVEFDRTGGQLARGLEAAHSTPRVLHAGGDATGLAVERVLVDAVRRSDITVREHIFASELMVAGGAVVGVKTLAADGTFEEHRCDAVVLASGGAGQLYCHTTNPAVATGDGVALALRAGAVVRDLELYQFHPTALAVPGGGLISEAVRGEGAVLRDSDGQRFMNLVDPAGELAPRDVVARGIAQQMEAQGGQAVVLDVTALDADFVRRRFPTLTALCRSHGYDWTRSPIPVTPAAHYWMGGVRTDDSGRTSLPGLYAVGEVACTGVHGANRLASNSLLEGAVFAVRCARALGQPYVGADRRSAVTRRLEQVDAALGVLGVSMVQRSDLQRTMWDAVGLYRSGPGLATAMKQLQVWSPDRASAAVRDHEDANLLTIARAMVVAADARKESRGSHFRVDFPQVCADHAHHLDFAEGEQAPC